VIATVFSNGDLRAVMLGFAGFNALEWGTWLAMIVYAYDQGGATTAGVVAFAQLVPAALFAPIASVLGDRYRPGRVLAFGYLVQAVTVLATAAALFADAEPLLVYIVGGAASTAMTFTRPAQSALVPTLARSATELTAANVVAGWVESMTVLIAPALAGLILGGFGFGAAFLVFGLFGVAALSLVIRVPGPFPSGDAEPVGAFTELAAGFGLLRREREPRILVMLLGAQFVGIGALDVLYAELAIGALEAGDAWAGYLNAAFGAGGALGIVATVALVGRRRLITPLSLGLGVWAVSLVALAISPTKAGAVLLLAAAGVGRTVSDVAGRTLLQRAAPGDLLARVFGLLEGLSMAGLALGSVMVPVLVAIGGTSAALVGVGAILPLGALLAGRHLREIDRKADVPVVEIGLLRSLELFAPLGAPTLESVARSLVPIEVVAGTAVVTQGDAGDRWYAIAGGTLEVRRDGRVLAELGRGKAFGEIALMRDVPRTATVTALTDCSLYALGKDEFLEAVTGHPRAVAETERIVEEHLATHR
jgi:MFS family permease